MNITIRIATINDVHDISYLGKKTFDQSFGYLFKDRKDINGYLEETFVVEKLRQSIVKPFNIYWIVFYEDIAIGYAKVQLKKLSKYIVSTQVCKLQKLYVLQEYVSKGVGGQLLNLIFKRVKEYNCEYIWLSVLKSNEKAIAFYKRGNYRIVGDHPFSIEKENFEFWVMSRKL